MWYNIVNFGMKKQFHFSIFLVNKTLIISIAVLVGLFSGWLISSAQTWRMSASPPPNNSTLDDVIAEGGDDLGSHVATMDLSLEGNRIYDFGWININQADLNGAWLEAADSTALKVERNDDFAPVVELIVKQGGPALIASSTDGLGLWADSVRAQNGLELHNDLTSGLLSTGLENSISGSIEARHAGDLAVDAGSVYILGPWEDGAVRGWWVEKRTKSNNALDTSFGPLLDGFVLSSGFGTGDPRSINLTAIPNHMILVGNDGANTRIEKRAVSTGALDNTFNAPDGYLVDSDVVTVRDAKVDANYIYVVGDDKTTDLGRIAKYSVVDGSLDGGFGIGGVQLSNASVNSYNDIAIDGTYMYLVSIDNSDFMRIEKRLLSTGALEPAFDGDGVVTSANLAHLPNIALDSSDGSIFIAGLDSGLSIVEKRLISTGGLVAAFDDGSQGPGVISVGSITMNLQGLAVDSANSHVYVFGDISSIWKVQQRNADTGALNYEQQTTNSYPIVGNDIELDSTHMYLVGIKWLEPQGEGADTVSLYERRVLVSGELDPYSGLAASSNLYWGNQLLCNPSFANCGWAVEGQGDGLGDHLATQALNMFTMRIYNVGSTGSQPALYASSNGALETVKFEADGNYGIYGSSNGASVDSAGIYAISEVGSLAVSASSASGKAAQFSGDLELAEEASTIGQLQFNTNVGDILSTAGSGSNLSNLYWGDQLICDVFETDCMSAGSGGAVWPDPAWAWRRAITIQENKVNGSGLHKDFPVLISEIHPDFRSVANGGHVEQANGGDIKFTKDDGTKMDHELEYYDPVTGEVIAWVELPFLVTDENTTIFIYYGNNAGGLTEWDTEGTWDSDFIGVWHMGERPDISTDGHCANEEVNSDVCDSTGYNNNADGINLDAFDHQRLRIGYANEFNDGNAERFIAPYDPSFDFTSAVTMEAWVNLDTDGTTRYIMAHHARFFNDLSYSLRLGSNDALNFGSGVSIHTDGPIVPENAWHHVAVTWDDLDDTYRYYVDGQPGITGIHAGPIPTHSEPFFVGATGSPGDYFDGHMDEVRLSKTARDADWLSTSFNNQNSTSTFYSLGPELDTSNPFFVSNWFTNTAGIHYPELDTLDYRVLIGRTVDLTALPLNYRFDIGHNFKSDEVSYLLKNVGSSATVINDVETIGWLAFAATAEGLSIFDVSDDNTASEIAALATGVAAWGLDVSGNTVYLATETGLKIIDVSRPGSPVLMSTYPYTTEYSVNSNLYFPTDVAIAGEYAYVVRTSSQAGELLAINVASPTAPTLSSSSPLTAEPKQLDIKRNDLVVALWYDTTGSIDHFDISTPGAPVFQDNYQVGGGQPVRAVDILFNRLYVVADDLYIYEWPSMTLKANTSGSSWSTADWADVEATSGYVYTNNNGVFAIYDNTGDTTVNYVNSRDAYPASSNFRRSALTGNRWYFADGNTIDIYNHQAAVLSTIGTDLLTAGNIYSLAGLTVGGNLTVASLSAGVNGLLVNDSITLTTGELILGESSLSKSQLQALIAK